MFIVVLCLSLLKVAGATQPTNIFLADTFEAPYLVGKGGGDILANVNAAILGQLFRLTEHYTLEPILADSWHWNAKTGTYHIKLKKGLRFHNGREATAKDLEFSLLRGFFSKSPAFFQIYVGSIEGAEDVLPGTPYRSGVVSGIKIINDYEISVKLRRPNPAFLFSLVQPFLSLSPIEEFKDDLVTWKKHPVGAGPYRVTKDFDGQKMQISRVTSVVGGVNEVNLWTAYDPKVTYDIFFKTPSALKKENYDTYISKNSVSVRGLSFSFANLLGSDLDFRRFMIAGIKRQGLAKILAPDGEPSIELLPKIMWGRADLKNPYDPGKAMQLFKKFESKLPPGKQLVGYVFGQNGIISSANQRLIDVIEESLRPYGVRVLWKTTTKKFLDPEIAKEAAFELSGMLSEHVDPLLMYGAYRQNGPFKFRKPLNGDPAFDALYEKAGQATDKPDRIKTMQALSQYVQDQAYFVPLAEEKNMILHRKGLVKSFGRQTQSLILFLDQIELN